MKPDLYSRTISPDEEKKGYFFVLKDRLSFFPLVGRVFELQSGKSVRKVKLESYHCECRGPEAPHDHYFVRWEDLKKGDRILVQRDAKKAGRYVLQLQSSISQKSNCG
ncbi:MAG TPA: hypothetical protein VJB38_11695 [Bacteroidota bacterium]|nr:hypothetical protein [Bacteroidota bacterium]